MCVAMGSTVNGGTFVGIIYGIDYIYVQGIGMESKYAIESEWIVATNNAITS